MSTTLSSFEMTCNSDESQSQRAGQIRQVERDSLIVVMFVAVCGNSLEELVVRKLESLLSSLALPV